MRPSPILSKTQIIIQLESNGSTQRLSYYGEPTYSSIHRISYDLGFGFLHYTFHQLFRTIWPYSDIVLHTCQESPPWQAIGRLWLNLTFGKISIQLGANNDHIWLHRDQTSNFKQCSTPLQFDLITLWYNIYFNLGIQLPDMTSIQAIWVLLSNFRTDSEWIRSHTYIAEFHDKTILF